MKKLSVALLAVVSVALFQSTAFAAKACAQSVATEAHVTVSEVTSYKCNSANQKGSELCQKLMACIDANLDTATTQKCAVISSGDSLGIIAKRYDWNYHATIGSWAKKYPNKNPHKISIGQKFCYDASLAQHGKDVLGRYKFVAPIDNATRDIVSGTTTIQDTTFTCGGNVHNVRDGGYIVSGYDQNCHYFLPDGGKAPWLNRND